MKIITAFVWLILVSSSAAVANSWVCTFPGQAVDGWLRGQVFVSMEGDEATVFDSLINQEHGGPIPAKVPQNNDSRLTLKWDLKRIELRHGYVPRIRYTLNMLKGSGQATFTGLAPELQDYRNSSRAGGNFSARGDCTRK